MNILWNKFMLFCKKVSFGENLVIRGRVHLHGVREGIILGENCTLNSSCDSNYTSGFSNTHLCANRPKALVIGNNVGISNSSIVATESVVIEDNVMIGSGVKIWDTDFHPISYNKRISGDSVPGKAVKIKEGAFIGACSLILKGVTVGKNAVIGAGSVVTKSVPDMEVWAGNPARFIRRIID